MDTIGLRIAHYLMLKNGGNQSELARHCGVSPQAVQKWIAGISEPRGKNFEKTAEFLGVSEVILKFGKDSTKLEEFSREFISPDPSQKPTLQDEADRFKAHFGGLSTAPYYAEIEEIIRLMEQTDDRGRIKALLAVEDALAVHAAVTLRANVAATLGQPIDDALVKIIQNYNQATSDGKMLILNATTAASKEEERARQLKAG